MKIKNIISGFFLFLLSFSFSAGAGFKVIQSEKKETRPQEKIVYLNLFERKDCAHCQAELKFLSSLKEKDFYLKRYDIADEKNLKLFNQIIEKYKLSASTPLNLIGDSIIVGFDQPENSGKQILKKVEEAKKAGKFNLSIDYYLNSQNKKNLDNSAPGCQLNSEDQGCLLPENESSPKIEIERKEEVSFFGHNISIKDMSLFTLSSVLGFIDGFNPCAMWVLLSFLIALSQVGSRKKMAIIAGIFILAEAIMYYLILVFWSSAWKIMPSKELVTFLIGLFAIGAGIFFLYKWWKNRKKFVCDSSSAEQQNKISARISEISQKPLTILTALSVLLLAFSVNVIEVACSLGIPQTFTVTLDVNNLSFWTEQFYIFIYTLFYMADDIIVFALALWGYKKFYQIGAKYSKLSTLLAGILILILGTMLAFFPTALVF